MRRTRKTTLAAAPAKISGMAGIAAMSAGTTKNWWPQSEGKRGARVTKLKDRDVVFLLRNLSTLTESGLSLPKALGTLAQERAMEKHRDILNDIRRHLENGESFHSALSKHGGLFDTVMVNQIKVGEHAGTLSATLTTIAKHREDGFRLRGEII